ncbi:hypothetical protein CCM_01389 [Cordyceps militaris CM01]|uniref:PH domain-containing protein n=1 Tax=Cordyceps militaris (strain CM01) TaxID=983644 RepID=G3J4R6_CORMM|nr:uncharacterized protein CCM_01389 [Cordyceps militaris CM01]EGX96731.1 hypothetical protein CCM_01389 [Cordyceps militaris CM01]
MDTLRGFLLVPPDRSQILGRASWKARYVLVGRKTPSHRDNGNSCNIGNATLPKTLPRPVSDEYFVCVYKNKDDTEPIQQWSVSLITDCQVQNVSHRKQTVAQPTLVITLSDKERKRRSSRAAGLMTSGKDASVTTLWFRAAPEDKQISLDDWARFILSKKSMSNSESPVSPVFNSPFITRSREVPEHFPRPGSSGTRLQHKSSTATYSTGPRERPVTFSSQSPSLRSKRSDLSSPSTTNNNYPIPGQLYTTVLPTDIGPSAELNGDSRDGWTSSSVYGRSTVNSPAHMRDSMSSHGFYGEIPEVNAPPAPGETILDRAFKLGHVPFAIPDVPGQEKLSSIARFDLLMRDAEQRRLQKETAGKRTRQTLESRFEDEDSSEETQSDRSHGADTGDDAQGRQGKANLISPSAQRALDFIADRNGRRQGQPRHRPSASRNHLSFHADAAPAAIVTAPPVRPHTAHAKSRPGAQRTQSTPHLIPSAVTHDIPNVPTRIQEESRKPAADKRISGSSSKRLSLNDITKRFSSTSSLLLVQTNASGASSRRSSEVDASSSTPRTNLSIRGTSQVARNREDQKCGWRGSVNVVSPEGGFL